ncbi:uncharacterized protein LOC126766627 [Bactrocera neohumeralis]|uniref:uncharacterized protein LOC126766627 n=1 Tax=Bactrocera neohumeralis TaxID=98809 RepID=UPI0021653A12|nr:uncharacterized protein LOC126766627 [Bactrocera neohumeralis]
MEKISFILANNAKIMYCLHKKQKWVKCALRAHHKIRRYMTLAFLKKIHGKYRRFWTCVEKSSFWENDVPTFKNDKFKNTFRIDRSTFQYLVDRLKNLQRADTCWRNAISLEKRIGIALYSLASSAEYRTVASLFGIGRTTVGEIVLEVCREIVFEIVNGFELLGFPQCYEAIDGCHIEVKPPKGEASDYFNFKGWYSTILFAAVNYRYRFTYINIGVQGRCNDSSIFECSALKAYHINNVLFARHFKFIEGVKVPILLIADSAFKLSPYVMKPFPFSVDQIEGEKMFNKKLSSCRRVVENAFGHLKARFRKIGKGLEVNIKNVNTIIKACCIMHNICNNRNDNINQGWIQQSDF